MDKILDNIISYDVIKWELERVNEHLQLLEKIDSETGEIIAQTENYKKLLIVVNGSNSTNLFISIRYDEVCEIKSVTVNQKLSTNVLPLVNNVIASSNSYIETPLPISADQIRFDTSDFILLCNSKLSIDEIYIKCFYPVTINDTIRLQSQLTRKKYGMESQVNSKSLTPTKYLSILRGKIEDLIDQQQELSSRDQTNEVKFLKDRLYKHLVIIKKEILDLQVCDPESLEYQEHIKEDLEKNPAQGFSYESPKDKDDDDDDAVLQPELADKIKRLIDDIDSLDDVEGYANGYASLKYWEDFYSTQKEPFEWYVTYKSLRRVFSKYIPSKESKILIVGIGNSTMGEDMYIDGYKDIDAIDYSSIVIDKMINRLKMIRNKESKIIGSINYRTMDACQLEYDDSYFDVVIDKGTMDAIICGENGQSMSIAMCHEISRCLKSGGVFILISCNKLKFLKDEKMFNWKVQSKEFNSKIGSELQFYLITKN